MSSNHSWMRGLSSIALAATLLVGVACNDDSDLSATTGDVSAPHDIALMGTGCDLRIEPEPAIAPGQTCMVFVVSSDEDELNVLDVTGSLPVWVRAPNPLRPLSIPVLRSPTKLVTDLNYARETPGSIRSVERRGPYLYASNPALSEISVVGASVEDLQPGEQFREVLRLQTEGVVSALTARGPDLPLTGCDVNPADPGCARSTLYYAIVTATGSEVRRVSLPGRNLTKLASPPISELVMDLPGETVSALAYVQNVLSNTESLAVSTRFDQGRSGRTFLRNVVTGVDTVVQFPGPIRALQPSPATEATGGFLWGLLDDEACGGQPGCKGLLAANVSSGELRLEAGRPMFPIRHEAGLAVNFSLFRKAKVTTTAVEAPVFDVIGVVAYANGQIGFFDPGTFSVLDGDPTDARVVTVEYRDAADAVLEVNPSGHGVPSTLISVTQNITLDELIVVTYQGLIPGLVDVPLDPGAPVTTTYSVDPLLLAQCPLPPGAIAEDANVCPRVMPGDFLVLKGGCAAELSVIGVDPGGSFTTTAPPAGCSGVTHYSVRAGGTRPLVVIGTGSGYLGRALVPGPGVPPDPVFRAYRDYFYKPQLEFPPIIRFPTAPLLPTVQRDHAYIIQTADGFRAQFIGIPDFNDFQQYRSNSPGGLAFAGKTTSLFVSLPAARQVLDVQTEDLDLNTLNISSIKTYQ